MGCNRPDALPSADNSYGTSSCMNPDCAVAPPRWAGPAGIGTIDSDLVQNPHYAHHGAQAGTCPAGSDVRPHGSIRLHDSRVCAVSQLAPMKQSQISGGSLVVTALSGMNNVLVKCTVVRRPRPAYLLQSECSARSARPVTPISIGHSAPCRRLGHQLAVGFSERRKITLALQPGRKRIEVIRM